MILKKERKRINCLTNDKPDDKIYKINNILNKTY